MDQPTRSTSKVLGVVRLRDYQSAHHETRFIFPKLEKQAENTVENPTAREFKMKFGSLVSVLIASSILLGANSAKAEDFNPLGPVRLGAMAGVGVPSPISAQAIFKYKEVVGANLELGMLPELTLPIADEAKVSQKMVDVSARLYPFKGAFFLGCGLGTQNLSLKARQTEQGVTGEVNLQSDTLFISPRIGFVHKFDFGLAIGMDIGAMIPFSNSLKTTGTIAGIPVNPPKEALDAATFVGKTPVPIIHLLQLGYIL